MKSLATYSMLKSGFESLRMNMRVNQDDAKNLQWLDLTCGEGANLAIAPPGLAIWSTIVLGFAPPTIKTLPEA